MCGGRGGGPEKNAKRVLNIIEQIDYSSYLKGCHCIQLIRVVSDNSQMYIMISKRMMGIVIVLNNFNIIFI